MKALSNAILALAFAGAAWLATYEPTGPGIDYPAEVVTGPTACECILDEDY